MNKTKGFTLFELLVSVSIIGILTAVVAFSFSSAQKKARDSRRVTDMNTIQKAAELYYAASSNYNYPGTVTMPWVAGTGETIMTIYPTDPKGTGWTGYSSEVMTISNYCVCAKIENAGGGNSANNNCGFTVAGSKDYFCVKNQQ